MSKEQFESLESSQQELSPEQKKAIEEVKSLNNKESVLKWAETYATVMDGYCLEAILGLIPEVGDVTTGFIDTVVYLTMASAVDASFRDKFKILGWQALDTVAGLVPVVGDGVDFVIKSNQKSAEILQKIVDTHRKELEKKYGKYIIDKLIEQHTSRGNKINNITAGTLKELGAIVNLEYQKAA